MIQINKTLKELDEFAAQFHSEIIRRLDTENRVSAQINGSPEKRAFYQAVLNNFRDIITGQPVRLEQLTQSIQPLLIAYKNSLLNRIPALTRDQKKAARLRLRTEFEGVFDYNTFSSDIDWAYNHVASLELNVCPYCNMQYTFTIRSPRGMVRPQFDHFMKKATFPYLALSFYNLVPSCYVCNASLKGQNLFLPSTHIHPFVEGVEDTLLFKTNVKKVDYLMGKTGFTLSLQATDNPPANKLPRAIANTDRFHINEQYRFHEAYAGNIIFKCYCYEDTTLSELVGDYRRNNGLPLFQDDTEILEMLFGNYIRPGSLHERVLAKLTNNIAIETGVLK